MAWTAAWLGALSALGAAATAQLPAPTLVVDASSRGGACSDSRGLGQVSLATPLCTLGAAIRLAPSGTTVLLRGGKYPVLTLEGRRYVARTTFRPYTPSEPVRLGGVVVKDSPNVRIQGFRIVNGVYSRESERLEIVGNDVSPGNIESYANTDVLIEGNYVHDVPGYPATTPEGYGIVLFTYQRKQNIRPVVRRNWVQRVAADPYHSVSSVDAVFDRNVGLDALPRPGSGTHVDALHTQGGRGLVIRLNRFDNIAHGLMFTDKDSQRVLIYNNLLTNIRYGYGVNGAVGPHAQILSNTVLSRHGINLVDEVEDTTGTLTGVVLMNNIFDNRASIGSHATEDHNLWIRRQSHKTYGPNDAFGRPRFDPEYRLLPGSPGYRAGHPGGRDMGALIDLWGAPIDLTPPVAPPKPKRKKGVRGLRIRAGCADGRLRLRLKGKRVRRSRAVRFSIDGWALPIDRRRPFVRSVRVTAPTRIRVVVRLKRKRKRPAVLVSLVPGCSPRR